MRYINNWDETRDRLTRYWNNTLDGCCIAAQAPRENGASHRTPPASLQQKWLDINWRIRDERARFRETYFAGDAFPNLWVDMGPGAIAGFIGAEPYLGEDCIWFEKGPILSSLESPPAFRLDHEQNWLRRTKELTEAFCQDSQGDYHVSINDLGGTLDIAADLRGAQQMLYDLIDEPEAVEALLEQLDDLWLEAFDLNRAWIAPYMRGCSDWMNIWCPESVYSVQCDMATMLSPAQYERFVLPSIVKQVRHLSHSMYHLHMYDTKGLSDQLDMMLAIPALDGIAFIAEPMGEDVSSERWLPYLRRVQAKGKKLMIFDQNAKRSFELAQRLSPIGLHIHANCASTQEANELISATQSLHGI